MCWGNTLFAATQSSCKTLKAGVAARFNAIHHCGGVVGAGESRTERKALSVYMDNDLWQWVRREAFNTERTKSDIVAEILADYAHKHPNDV